ncbi:hypothetical protein BH23PLA1_BH23PLA1_29090 [soil metagenome]
MFRSKNRHSRRNVQFRPTMDVLSDRIAPSGFTPIPLPQDDPEDAYDMEYEEHPEVLECEEDDEMIIPAGML